MDAKQVKKIPYGISDYVRIRQDDCYYVDKTQYLPEIENLGDYLFFIRPRRFGKSLLLSMMAAYYDVLMKDRFEELFLGTAIYKNPTKEQGKYLVLAFNFSQVDTNEGKMEVSFVNHVRGIAVDFIRRYRNLLSANTKIDYYSNVVEASDSAADILSNLVMLSSGSNCAVYLVIDEYDNFANTILATSGETAYHALTHGGGMLRSFFNIVKGGTTGNNAPIKRLFITGVSPVTMDDVTSGFNIGTNVSIDAVLNQVVGFSRQEMEEMVNYYRDSGLIVHKIDELMELFSDWYGNYLFSDYAPGDQRLYNSDMILYFLREYMKRNAIPNELIDRNVRIDYGKLRHLVVIDKGKSKPPTINGNFSKLKQIIEDGETATQLVKGFPLDKLSNPENFKSLLFYFGLLTIKGTDLRDTILEIPNETVRRLFYDYIKEAYEETGTFSLDLAEYSELIKGLAAKGEWKPLFRYLTDRMNESFNLRDLMTGEKAVQTFLNVYLGLSDLFIIHSEKEMNKGFADLVMEPFLARYETIKYSYIIEIKYLKAGAKPDDTSVKSLAAEAREQLKNYTMDKKYKKTIAKTTLIKLILVFSGHRLMTMEEV